jgi:hypothetical protein
MILNLLPHQARPAVLSGKFGVMDIALLLMMYGGASMNRRGPAGYASQSNSRHSMYTTCGPRDMISIVTPRLRGQQNLFS